MMPQQNYAVLVRQLKEEIRSARIRASLSANVHLLVLYWKIGKAILQSQQTEGWGTKVIDNLAKDLRSEFPDMKGISPRNLKYMRAFAEAYPEFVQVSPAQNNKNLFVQQAAVQIEGQNLQEPLAKTANQILQQPAAQLPWFHICTLLDKVKGIEERVFYMQQAAENGWSRNVMVHQIESGLYKRKGAAITNSTQLCLNPKVT